MKILIYQLFILALCTTIGACSTSSSGGMPSIPTESSEASSESESSQQASNENSSSSEKESENTSEQKQSSSNSSTAEQSGEEQSQKADSQGAQTDEEKVALLDKQLERELSEYDKELHGELEKAEEQRQTRAKEQEALEAAEDGIDADDEFASGADGEDPDAEQGGNEAEQVAKANSEQSAGGEQADDTSQSKQGDNGKGSGATPKDIPSGNDDDVVARQLREAAENEQDPELREKLWDEYRKYKKQQANNSAPPSTVSTQ